MRSGELASTPLRVVLVEDNPDDAFLVERHLRRNGFDPVFTRVQTAADMLTALQGPDFPNIILADYSLPNFSGSAALQLLKSTALDIPFIMLSGAVSEDTAVDSMRLGAHDYVSKQNLARLVPAIERELNEAVTRRNRLAAEQALLASEARFHSLVEAMPLGLFLSDASGRILYANHAVERLLGYSQATLLSGSVTLQSISPALDKAHGELGAHKLLSEPFETTCIRRDAQEIEVLIGVSLLNPQAPRQELQIAAFIADLALQKRSEEVLRRTEKLAVAGRLAASISHEINNPLEAVTNCLYLIGHTAISSEARGYLDLAQKELDRVTQITVQTLRFYRASTRPANTDLHELINTVLALTEGRLRHLRIQVIRDFRAHPILFAHDGEIRQVIANLVGNAIDALFEGGRIIIRTAGTRDWHLGRKGVAITVADTGTGMDPDTTRRIFEPFFSTKGTTGTGLGLWISHEIILKHHGRIHVRSRRSTPSCPGGTVFRLFIPAQDESSFTDHNHELSPPQLEM